MAKFVVYNHTDPDTSCYAMYWANVVDGFLRSARVMDKLLLRDKYFDYTQIVKSEILKGLNGISVHFDDNIIPDFLRDESAKDAQHEEIITSMKSNPDIKESVIERHINDYRDRKEERLKELRQKRLGMYTNELNRILGEMDKLRFKDYERDGGFIIRKLDEYEEINREKLKAKIEAKGMGIYPILNIVAVFKTRVEAEDYAKSHRPLFGKQCVCEIGKPTKLGYDYKSIHYNEDIQKALEAQEKNREEADREFRYRQAVVKQKARLDNKKYNTGEKDLKYYEKGGEKMGVTTDVKNTKREIAEVVDLDEVNIENSSDYYDVMDAISMRIEEENKGNQMKEIIKEMVEVEITDGKGAYISEQALSQAGYSWEEIKKIRAVKEEILPPPSDEEVKPTMVSNPFKKEI